MSAQHTPGPRVVGAHVGGRAYTVWLAEDGSPLRVTSCGTRVQQLSLQSRTARAAIAKATGSAS